MFSILLASIRPEQMQRTVRQLRESHLPSGSRIEISDMPGTGKAYNGLLAAASPHNPIVVLATDDCDWDYNWWRAAFKCWQDTLGGYGMVCFRDRYNPDPQVSCWLADRKFIKEKFGGVIHVPHYQHYFTDVELVKRAQRANAWAHCQTAFVSHLHDFNAVSDDETYIDSRQHYDADGATYARRLAAGFPDDFKAAISG